MPSTTFAVFQNAIKYKQNIECTYDGYPRIVCPHAVGWKDGVEQAIVFQYGGSSSKGLPPGGDWRCLTLNRVRAVTMKPGPWHTGENHSRPNTCIDRVDTEVDY